MPSDQDDADGLDVANSLYGGRAETTSDVSGNGLLDHSTEEDLLEACLRWAPSHAGAISELDSLFRPMTVEGETPRVSGDLPTLCLPVLRTIDVGEERQQVGALWIELKPGGKLLSDGEKEWRRRLIRRGHAWTLSRSVDDFRAAVTDYVSGDFFLDI